MYRKELAQALHIENEDEHLDSGAVQRSVYLYHRIGLAFLFCIKKETQRIETYIPMYLYLIGLQMISSVGVLRPIAYLVINPLLDYRIAELIYTPNTLVSRYEPSHTRPFMPQQF